MTAGRSEVLLIGGRSGVGKSTAAAALHDLLVEADVPHAVIEGDALDLAHPAPHLAHPEHRLAERNLRAMWREYRVLGYSRLVFTNTLSVLHAADLAAAMGDDPVVTAVLLRPGDATTGTRLARRALGTPRAVDVAHSARTARLLDEVVPSGVHRLDTDGRTPSEVAAHLLALTGWTAPPLDRSWSAE